MSVDYAVRHTTQRDRVLLLLRDLRWHHFSELHHVGGIRYSARILELKRLGYDVSDREAVGTGKEYCLLCSEPTKAPQVKRVKAFLDPSDVEGLLAGETLPPRVRNALDSALQSFRHCEHRL